MLSNTLQPKLPWGTLDGIKAAVKHHQYFANDLDVYPKDTINNLAFEPATLQLPDEMMRPTSQLQSLQILSLANAF